MRKIPIPSNLKVLYDRGMTQQAIALRFKVTPGTVNHWFNRIGIPRKNRRSAAGWESTPRAVMSPSPKDIAWAAGFIEGEGCFITPVRSKKRGRQYKGAKVSASQVNKEPLVKLQRMFGGRVSSPRLRSKWSVNKSHVWVVHGARARGVAMTLYFFLSKRRQLQARKLWRIR